MGDGKAAGQWLDRDGTPMEVGQRVLCVGEEFEEDKGTGVPVGQCVHVARLGIDNWFHSRLEPYPQRCGRFVVQPRFPKPSEWYLYGLKDGYEGSERRWVPNISPAGAASEYESGYQRGLVRREETAWLEGVK